MKSKKGALDCLFSFAIMASVSLVLTRFHTDLRETGTFQEMPIRKKKIIVLSAIG